jgi:hypothetical protein
VAREIAALVPTFHNYRAEIPGATWRVDPSVIWQVAPQSECHAALEAAGVPFRPVGVYPTPVPSPVEILGPIDGVWFRISHEDRALVISCELARRLPALVAILREFDIRGVELMSAYRETPRPSFHTMGLALDIGRVWTDRGWMSVLTDFEETPMSETCAATPTAGRARRMLRVRSGGARCSRACSRPITTRATATTGTSTCAPTIPASSYGDLDPGSGRPGAPPSETADRAARRGRAAASPLGSSGRCTPRRQASFAK